MITGLTLHWLVSPTDMLMILPKYRSSITVNHSSFWNQGLLKWLEWFSLNKSIEDLKCLLLGVSPSMCSLFVYRRALPFLWGEGASVHRLNYVELEVTCNLGQSFHQLLVTTQRPSAIICEIHCCPVTALGSLSNYYDDDNFKKQ